MFKFFTDVAFFTISGVLIILAIYAIARIGTYGVLQSIERFKQGRIRRFINQVKKEEK